jgi:hypothetical protein
MLDREIVGVDEHAFRAGDLVLERQDALVRARAAHGDAVRAQGQHALQGMLARRDFDHAAGLRVEELLLQGFSNAASASLGGAASCVHPATSTHNVRPASLRMSVSA